MYVCVSGGLPPYLHNQLPWNLAWATPNVDPRDTPYSDPVWKTLKYKELGGGQQTKVFLGVGLPCKILFGGLTQTCGPHGPPYQMGGMLWELGGGQQTKVAPQGGFVKKIYLWGGSP
jgi:hypothetical protein